MSGLQLLLSIEFDYFFVSLIFNHQISSCQLLSDHQHYLTAAPTLPMALGLSPPSCLHPTLFLLTIPTLLTLQESLMKRCLYADVHVHKYTVTPPLFSCLTIISSNIRENGIRADTEVCARVTGSQQGSEGFLDTVLTSNWMLRF